MQIAKYLGGFRLQDRDGSPLFCNEEQTCT